MLKLGKLNLFAARKFISSAHASNFSIKNSNTNSNFNLKKNFSINRSLCTYITKSFSNNSKNDKPEEKLNIYQSAKKKIKQYGTRGIVFYCFMYVANGLMFYFLFKYKFIQSEKFLIKVNEWGVDKYINTEKILNMVGQNNLDIFCAIMSNELFEIIRVPLVIMLIPRIFRKMK